MKVISPEIVLVLILCSYSTTVRAELDPYTIPQPLIEVFRPRGLRVSIPNDHMGIRLFAFHGVVNRDLNGLEAGDLSQDILNIKNDRWNFEDKRLKLNLGDVLHFWLFVIKDNLGYRLDDQSYVVTDFTNAPPGFISGPKNSKHKITPSPVTQAYPSNTQSINSQNLPPPSLESASCVCPQRPIEIVPPLPICNLPSQAPTTEHTLQFTTATPFTLPEDLVLWRELLVNFSRENTHLRNQLVEVQEDKTYLVKKLESITDVNLHKLILSGRIYDTDSAIVQVETVLREKLGISNFNIVKSAITDEKGSIIFELKSLEDKLFVLRKAKEKLVESKIKISDTSSVLIIPK